MITKNGTEHSSAETIGDHEDFDDEDRLITDVTWATNDHSHLLFKQMNRVQDHEVTSLVTIGAPLNKTTVTLARRYQPNDGGWIEVSQSMVYVPNNSSNSTQYIDLADSDEGYLHLAMFTADTKKPADPLWLTTGEWEVVPNSVIMDVNRKLM